MDVWLPSLNKLCASMRKNPQSSYCKLCCHRKRIFCMTTFIPPSIPAQSWSVPYASFDLVPATESAHFDIILCRFYTPLNQEESRVFVQPYDPPSHMVLVGCPRTPVFGHSLCNQHNNIPEYHDFLPGPQEPLISEWLSMSPLACIHPIVSMQLR